MNTTKKTLFLFLGAALASAAFAQSIANKTGAWEETSTWYQNNKPIETSDIRIDAGITVTLSSAATVKGFSATGGYTKTSNLIVTGEDASLTFTGSTNLYYQYMLDMSVTNGATFSAQRLNWGGGGYWKFNIDASTFSGGFADQFQGGKFVNPNDETAGKDSGVYLKNGSTATATEAWKIGNSQSADHYLTVSLNNSSLDMKTFDFSVNAGANAATTGTQTTFEALNGSRLILGSKTIGTTATGSGAKVIFNVSDSAMQGLTGLNFTASGASSNVDWNLTNLKVINSENGNLTAGTTVIAGGISSVASGAGASITSSIKVSNIKANGLNVTAAGATSNKLMLSNSQVDLNENILTVGGNATLTLGGVSKISNVSAFTTGSNSTLIIMGQGSSVTSKSAAQSWGFGAGGEAVTIQFGGYDENNNFVAASESAMYNTWELKVYSSADVKFILGNSNFSDTKSTNAADAIFTAHYTKAFESDIFLDLTNITLAEGTYYVELISSVSGESLLDKVISGSAKTLADWEALVDGNVTTKDGVEYKGLSLGGSNNNILYAEILVVPEPATYAAIFGVLALGFAAYRRNKR